MSCVDFLLETWNLAVSCCGRAKTAKNNAKKRDARAKFVFAFLNVLFFCLSRCCCPRRHCQISLSRVSQRWWAVVVLISIPRKVHEVKHSSNSGSLFDGIGLLPLKKDDYSFFIGANQWTNSLQKRGQYSGVSKNTLEPTNNIKSVKVNSKVTTVAAPTVRRRLLLKEWYRLSKARFKRRATAVPN